MFAQKIPVTAFEVADIASGFTRMTGNGVPFTQAPTDAGPVKIAEFADTCGNLIQLYRPA
jgi:glyoxylase I family protein